MGKLILILIAVLSGLIQMNVARAGYVAPELKGTLREIKRDIRSFCAKHEYAHKNFQFVFEKLQGEEIGRCVQTPKAFRVYVDSIAWANLTDDLKYQVLVHEATHCMLRVAHTSDENNYMFPYSRPFLSKAQTRGQFIANLTSVCSGQPAAGHLGKSWSFKKKHKLFSPYRVKRFWNGLAHRRYLRR